jgi:uncharacterized membrane protein YgdD (TMEM256/DUF423 family)
MTSPSSTPVASAAALPGWWVGAALGFVAVAAGAFGAHALKARLDPEQLAWWDTGARYLALHAPAALAASLLEAQGRPRARAARICFGVGGVIFAGTLWAMALGGPRWLGAVTPLGGLSLLAGWLTLGWAGSRGVRA